MMRRRETLLVMPNTHIDVARRGETLLVMPNTISTWPGGAKLSEHQFRHGQEG